VLGSVPFSPLALVFKKGLTLLLVHLSAEKMRPLGGFGQETCVTQQARRSTHRSGTACWYRLAVFALSHHNFLFQRSGSSNEKRRL
jgi:hypothetical protein